MLVSDTVGFIDRLPHTLVAAFRATFEEVTEVDLLLHVVDPSPPAPDDRMVAVYLVRQEVGAAALPQLLVFNKFDRVDVSGTACLGARHPEAACVSAWTRAGLDALVRRLAGAVRMEQRRVALELDQTTETDRRRLAAVYRYGRVLAHDADNGQVSVEADVPRRLIEQWRSQSRRAQATESEGARGS